MSDSRNARRAHRLDARFQLLLCLLRDRLVIRRVQRRVDGNEPDDPVPELEEPESRGGRARIMILDVEEVYTSEDVLGRVFDERSIFPIIIPWERAPVRVLEPNKRRKRKGGLVHYQSTKNMMGTAGAKKAGSTCNQPRTPYELFGHQSMYCANMEEMAIHMARVTG